MQQHRSSSCVASSPSMQLAAPERRGVWLLACELAASLTGHTEPCGLGDVGVLICFCGNQRRGTWFWGQLGSLSV